MEEFQKIVLADWKASWPMVAALIAALALDVVMGTVAAFGQQRLNSTVSRVGIARKVAVMVCLAVVGLADPFTPNVTMPVIGTVTLTAGVAAFWFVNELISVLEKAALLGVPLPSGLIAALEKVRGQAEAALGDSAQEKTG